MERYLGECPQAAQLRLDRAYQRVALDLTGGERRVGRNKIESAKNQNDGGQEMIVRFSLKGFSAALQALP